MDFRKVYSKVKEVMFYDIFENWDVLFFILIIGLEFCSPFLSKEKENARRLLTNFGHVVVSKVFIILMLGLFGFTFKYLDHAVLSKGFISSLPISFCIKALISFVILDLAIYWQHRLSHKLSFLWAFHQVHHQDKALTVSTALRFHFGEIFYSLIYKTVLLIIFGIPLKIFLAFEAFLFACAAFNHANIKLPLKIESVLSYVLVTPKFHRIHHSVVLNEQQSNYSFSVPWWDMLFKTYTAKKSVVLVGIENEKVLSFLEQVKTPYLYIKNMKKVK